MLPYGFLRKNHSQGIAIYCPTFDRLVKVENLLGNMHEVYQKVNVAGPGYGVFVAGPSKTADIEQSLVIGAHGPRSMIVYLMD